MPGKGRRRRTATASASAGPGTVTTDSKAVSQYPSSLERPQPSRGRRRHRLPLFFAHIRASTGTHPIQMTIATTNGRTVWAFRYSSEHDSRSHYFSTRMDALKAHYPDIEELAGRSGETRVVVSEPLGDLPGAWNEVGPSEHDEGREPARANAPRSERPSSAPRRDATLRAAL
jgi:hypothetical protein